MVQVILNKVQLDLIGDLRHVHVNVGAYLALTKKGVMDKDEALKRIGEEVVKAEGIWGTLTREGI